MSVQIRTILKGYFNAGDKPKELEFANLLDSFWHKADDTLAVDWANVSGKPSTYAPSSHTHAWADITSKPTFAAVAISGAYADLTGLPTLFSGVYGDLSGIPSTFAPSAHNHAASDITSGALAAARLAAGAPTDTYVIKSVSGVPTWAAVAGGGSGWALTGSTTSGTDKLGSNNTYVNIVANGGDYGQIGAATGSIRIGQATQGTVQSRNAVYGDFAGGGGMGGSDNCAFGRLSLYQSSGIGHSAFGQGAGYCPTAITGNYLSFFGFETKALTAGLSNATALGANVWLAQSNTVILGDAACSTGIGTNTLDAAAKFQIDSTTKGALLPRTTMALMAAIPAPPKGLELFVNDDNGKMWYDGTRWIGFRFNGTKFQGYNGSAWSNLD